MSRSGHGSDLSLKWLEVFRSCARDGSVRAAAAESGLSPSTVSHHLRSLEDHLGAELFDRGRRPMELTPRGRIFLRNIDDALDMLRKATAEAVAAFPSMLIEYVPERRAVAKVPEVISVAEWV